MNSPSLVPPGATVQGCGFHVQGWVHNTGRRVHYWRGSIFRETLMELLSC